jgi:hypothetical protein
VRRCSPSTHTEPSVRTDAALCAPRTHLQWVATRYNTRRRPRCMTHACTGATHRLQNKIQSLTRPAVLTPHRARRYSAGLDSADGRASWPATSYYCTLRCSCWLRAPSPALQPPQLGRPKGRNLPMLIADIRRSQVAANGPLRTPRWRRIPTPDRIAEVAVTWVEGLPNDHC